ncbi:uncharacterized protein [Brachyistius frenatus]|uniref:uncharacterized protein n=1 Tax=Brachyistius frenatus TaxID=100188 RepID=UPI0037E935B8
MKSLCVAAVVLSLISVCQPASLACEQLVKPVDQGPDLSGRWYVIATSTELCLTSTLLNAVFWPSIAADITSKDIPNIYSANIWIKVYGYCNIKSQPFFYANKTFLDVNSNNTPTGEGDVLLQTGCPDCLVLKGDTVAKLKFLSRRQVITAAELKEFEMQAECLGWSKPEVFNSDHDYDNCKTIDDVSDDEATAVLETIRSKMFSRVKSMIHNLIKCIIEAFLSYFNST